MGFLEQNEVIVVARKKGDQFSTAGGGKTAGIPLQNSEMCVRGVDFLENAVASCGPGCEAVVMRQEG